MRVLLVTDRMDCGGAETHIAQLARTLSARGTEVLLASGGGAIADRLTRAGFRHVQISFSSRSPLGMLRARRRLLRLIRTEGIELVHAHARLPAALLRVCPVPVVVTVHAHFSVTPLSSRLAYWGDRTVAVSEDLRAYVCENYRLDAARVCVIPNGIDCDRFSPMHRGDSRAPHIVFASRLDSDCALGAELLCRLAPALCRRYRTLTVTVAGGGDAYAQICLRAASANRLIGREAICCVGKTSDMAPLLASADVFVGVSRAAMEAAACGCAVILCGNEGYGGVLDQHTAPHAAASNFCARGSFKPTAAVLLRDLQALLSNQALLSRTAAEGRAWVCSHNSAEQMCRETLAVYAALLERPLRIPIAVGGYFGCGNLGDDAILCAFLHILRKDYPRFYPVVLSGKPKEDRRRFGVACVGRKNPFAVLAALLRARVLIFAGGSLLQNITGQRSLWYYLALLRTAQLLGCETVLCAAGLGPLIGTRAQKATARVLSRCRYISLRDEASHRFLLSLGVDAARLHLCADLSWLLPLPHALSRHRLQKRLCIPPHARLLCVVLHGGEACATSRRQLLCCVRLLMRRYGLLPLFLIFDEHRDGEVTRMAHRALGGYFHTPHTPQEAITLLTLSQVLLSMRLHAILFATLAKTPALGISPDARDTKIPALCLRTGQDCLPPDADGVPDLVDAAEKTLLRPEKDPILCDCVEDERKKAQKDLANIAEMIYNMYRHAPTEEHRPVL